MNAKKKKPQVKPSETPKEHVMQAGFWRRMGAWLYDAMLLIGVLFLTGGLCIGLVSLAASAGLIDLTGYLDASDYLGQSAWFQLTLALVTLYFYIGFWIKGGQTLGMKAWKLYLQNLDGERINVTQGLIRCGTSAFGLGNFLVLIDPYNRSFQDQWASTRMIYIPEKK